MWKNFWTFIGIIFLAIVLALVMWSFANAYDKVKPAEDPELVYDGYFTYIRVRAIGTAEGMYYDNGWKTRETLFDQLGSGFVVKGGFVMTAAHVIIPETVYTPISKYGVHHTEPLKILDRMLLIYHYSDTPIIAKVHYINRELDVAILKYKPTGIFEPIPYEMEYCWFELEPDDVVFSFLHKRNEDDEMMSDLELTYGKVLAKEPTTPDMKVAWFSPYDITLEMDIQGGDSGSPLFALRDGVPILIGVLRAMYYDEVVSLTYAATLPKIRRYLHIDESSKKKIILMLPNIGGE